MVRQQQSRLQRHQYAINGNDFRTTGIKLHTSTKQISPRRGAGFTLIEITILAAIVALLAMIAYPTVVQRLRNSNRSDAQMALAQVGVNLERFFATNGTYTTNTALLGLQIDGDTAYSDANHYVVTVAPGETGIVSSYVITATAAGGDTQANDDGCTVLSLDSLGRRVPDPNDSRCW